LDEFQPVPVHPNSGSVWNGPAGKFQLNRAHLFAPSCPRLRHFAALRAPTAAFVQQKLGTMGTIAFAAIRADIFSVNNVDAL
jgi:hypothetical protein